MGGAREINVIEHGLIWDCDEELLSFCYKHHHLCPSSCKMMNGEKLIEYLLTRKMGNINLMTEYKHWVMI